MITSTNTPDWKIVDKEMINGEYVVTVKYLLEPTVCPHCGTNDKMCCLGTVYTYFRDAPVEGKKAKIRVIKRRYACGNCKQHFTQSLNGMEEAPRITMRCLHYIREQVFQKPFAQVARDVGLNSRMIAKTAWSYIDAINAGHRPVAPQTLGLCLLNLHEQCYPVFLDLDANSLIDILPHNGQCIIQRWLESLPHKENIRVIKINMVVEHKQAVQAALGYGIPIVVDMVTVASNIRSVVRELEKLKGLEKIKPNPVDVLLAFGGIYDALDLKSALAAYAMWSRMLTSETKDYIQSFTAVLENWHTEIWNHFHFANSLPLNEVADNIAQIVNGASNFTMGRAHALYTAKRPSDMEQPALDLQT